MTRYLLMKDVPRSRRHRRQVSSGKPIVKVACHASKSFLEADIQYSRLTSAFESCPPQNTPRISLRRAFRTQRGSFQVCASAMPHTFGTRNGPQFTADKTSSRVVFRIILRFVYGNHYDESANGLAGNALTDVYCSVLLSCSCTNVGG